MAHALNEEVQELVAQALEGRKLSMAEASVYKAAEELQRLQNGVLIFKTAMRRVLESESTAKTRRAAARLLFARKREGVYQKADEELLAARGLSDWGTSDGDLRETAFRKSPGPQGSRIGPGTPPKRWCLRQERNFDETGRHSVGREAPMHSWLVLVWELKAGVGQGVGRE
jgi:hypothetical protein